MKNNDRHIVLCLTLLLMTVISSLSSANDASANVDLRDRNWGRGEVFEIDGQWDFAWQRLVPPGDNNKISDWQTVTVPGAWHRQASLPDIQAHGYASYHLTVFVPESLSTVYLSMPDMASAYQLWANSKWIGGNGRVGIQKQDEQPAYLPRVFELTPEQGRIDLLLHTSNFHYQWGGIWYSPSITDQSGVFSVRELPLIKASIYSTLLLGTGVLALLLFLSRPQDRKVLYFSLFCFAIGMRRLLIDERIFYLTDWGNWALLQLLENVSVYLSLPFFLGYFYHCFKEDTDDRLPIIGWVFALPFCLIAASTDVAFYTQMNVPFQILAVLTLPYILVCYFRAFKSRRKGSRIFGISLLVFAASVINDSLNYSYLINTPNMMHLGALAFVLFQLSALIQRYLQNFRTIEVMSDQLSEQNKELRTLDSFKDEFLATTSHELRTPLHGIAGLTRALRKNSHPLSAHQSHTLDLISATTERLSNLVNDILDYSSLKHGKLRLQLNSIHLKPLVDNILFTLNTTLDTHSIRLQCDIDEQLEPLKADEQRLQQILFNLIGNAIKHTQKGHIRVSAEREGRMIKIHVDDTGSGFPEENLKHLFQPFEQITHNAPSQSAGTGLGLAITRKLVTLHEGELEVESVPNQGTRISFTIPVANAMQCRQSDTPSEAEYEEELKTPAPWSPPENPSDLEFSVPRGDSACVYYADDEVLNRELVFNLLSDAGYSVQTFNDAPALLAAMTQAMPDLILLDLMMPGMNGTEACREIRKHHSSRQLPIMMLTARHQMRDILTALGAGANDYLTKPYHEKELLARLYSQLSIRRFWQSSAENERLKEKLTEQETLHASLQSRNRQLQESLDCAAEPLLMVGLEGTLLFSNKAARNWIGAHDCATLSQLITAQCQKQLQSRLDDNASDFTLELTFTGNDQKVEAAISVHRESDSGFMVLMLNPVKKEESSRDLLARLTRELAQSRQQIAQIESAIVKTLPSNNQSHTTSEPDRTENHQSSAPSAESKELVVRTLRTALLTWERYTNQSKADLAEKSQCWRVYLDGTTAKTRTLDKYLSVKTLPAKPRWRTVIKTANYVLDHCELSEADQQELTQLIEALDHAFA